MKLFFIKMCSQILEKNAEEEPMQMLKIEQKSTKNIKLSTIFVRLKGDFFPAIRLLKYSSYKIYQGLWKIVATAFQYIVVLQSRGL